MLKQNPAKPFSRSWQKIRRPWRCDSSRGFQTHEILACLRSRASFTVSTIKTLVSILNPQRRWRAGLCGLLVAASGFAAELPALLEYRVGDQAEADIITPVPLVVFDPVRTENLRKAEAQRVNPVFRHLPAAAAQSETTLKSAFTNAQSRFTAGLENRFRPSPPVAQCGVRPAALRGISQSLSRAEPGFSAHRPAPVCGRSATTAKSRSTVSSRASDSRTALSGQMHCRQANAWRPPSCGSSWWRLLPNRSPSRWLIGGGAMQPEPIY